MTDNHAHVGWFNDSYYSPMDIWQKEKKAGIDDIVVASTSTCAELYKLVVSEMRELIRMGGEHIHPLLWLTPRMFHSNCRWALPYLLHSGIRWEGAKFHWRAHCEWYNNRKLLHNALEIARWLDVPVLMHTGEYDVCHAGVFKEVCLSYNDLSFVLAHGRPLDETIDVLSSCSNTYVDTAFMPATEVKQLADSGFCDRVLLGTDAPINQLFYKDIDTSEYIRNYISELRKLLSEEQFETIVNNILYK
jgi:hypothetical protein